MAVLERHGLRRHLRLEPSEPGALIPNPHTHAPTPVSAPQFTLTDRVTRDLPAQPVRFEVAVDRFPRSVVTDTDWRQWVEHLDMYYEFPHSEYGSNDRMRAAVARLWRYDSQDRARNFFNMYRILRELYFLSGERLVFHTRTFDEARFLRYRAIWWSSDPVSKMDETPFYAACLQTPEMHALKFELTDTFKALSCKCDVPAPVNRALTFTCHRPRAPRREVRNMTLLYVHQPAVHTEARDFQAASSHRPTEFFCVSDVKESLKEANRDVSGALPPFASSLHDHLRATGTPTTPDRPVPHPYKTAMAVSSGTCACTPHGAQDVRMWQIRASEACAGHGRCAPSAANSLVSECVCDETHRRPSQAELANARLEVDAARREYRGPAASAHYLDELGDVCSIERCAVQTSREAGERLVPLFVPSVPKDVCGPGRCRRHPVRGEFGCECPAGTFPPFCSQPLC